MVRLLSYSLILLCLLPLQALSSFLTYPGGLAPLNLTCETSSSAGEIFGTPCQVSAGDNVQLSISLTAAHVRKGGDAFRAHPLLVSCLQRFSSKLSATPEILQFYLSPVQTLTVITNVTDVDADMLSYHQAGLAVSFRVKNTTFQMLLETAVTSCVDKFAADQFSVGLVQLENDTLDLQLRQTFKFYPISINVTYFSLVDASLRPSTLPVCSTAAVFPLNSSYPLNDSTPQQVVGQVYTAASKNSSEYLALLQYPATNVQFSGCPQQIRGNTVQLRCDARVMSYRLYRKFRVLTALLDSSLPQLVVMRSWSVLPLNITDPQCRSSPLNTSLFSEGRASLLNVTGTGSLSLSQLAALCQCSGFDYVYYGCGYVLVAVRKQRSTPPLTVVFPESLLLPITPSGAAVSLYYISPSVSSQSPLFDSDGVREDRLSASYSVAQLAGQDRFFRMHPVLVTCLQMLTDSLAAYRPYYSIRILQAYSRNLSSQQEDYTTGLAVKISVTPSGYPLLNLTLMTIRSCASYVSQQHNTLRKLQLGLNSDSLYLAIAKDFNAWNTTPFYSASDSTFYSWAYSRYMAGLSNTLVNPSNENMTCANTILTSPPDPSYISPYTLPSVIAYLTSVQPNNCVSEVDTSFCKESKADRDVAIEELLVIIRRKHWLVPEAAMVEAITKCFSLCATCMEGDVWLQKLAHCDNMVHWIPFRLISEPDNMHFYVMENMTIKEYACSGSRFCVSKSPLYAVLAYTVEALFRPDPNKAQELSFYSMADNPIPVYKLVDTVFALNGVGNVTVWVANDNDLLVLKPVLRVLMLDNHNVNCVDIRLFQADRLTAVQRQLDGNIHDWTTNGCPAYSRDVIAPYTITIVNTSPRARRDVHLIEEGANFGDYLATRWRFAERRWIEKQIL